MARQSLRRKEHHVDADFIRRARKAGDEHFRRRRDASQAPLVDRKVEVFGALAPLHLYEGERRAAPRDQVDLPRGNAEPLLKSAVTAPFLSAYREHIDCEEEQAYPLAFQDATEDQQRAWGEEMAQRRISQPKLG